MDCGETLKRKSNMKRILKYPKALQNQSDTISLCMIMKNEEKRLRRCLDSVLGLVHEIIIVDTGSTDKSKAIAESYGAKVIDSVWCDDFAFSRNVGLKAATKNWILILDPDELISKADLDNIREHTLHWDIIAFQMATRNYGNNQMQINARKNPMDTKEAKDYKSFVPSTKTRLFQNHKGLFFEGCWHELIDYSLQRKKLKWSRSPVQIHHYPEEIQQESHKKKAYFYLRIAEKKVRQNPQDLQAWWELAVAENICGYKERALRSANKTLDNKIQSADRLFFISSLNGSCGRNKQRDYLFEKAICLLYPNLTHFNLIKKLAASQSI